MNVDAPNPIFAGFLLWDIEADRVLAVSRKTDFNDWGLPSGKIERSEAPAPAALRELKEEAGLVLPGHLFELSDERQHVKYCEHAEGHGIFYFVPLGPSALESVNERLPDQGRGTWQPPGEGMVTWKNPKELLKPNQTFRKFNRGLFQHFNIIPSAAPPVDESTITVAPEGVVVKSGDADLLLRVTELLRRECRLPSNLGGETLFEREADRETDGYEVWDSDQGWRFYGGVESAFEVNIDCTPQQALDLYERYLDMYEACVG